MAVPKVALGIGDTIYIMGSNLNNRYELGKRGRRAVSSALTEDRTSRSKLSCVSGAYKY